jgi:hypothetical protein
VEFGEWKGGIFSRYLATLGRTGGSGFNSCDLGVFLLGVLVTERGKGVVMFSQIIVGCVSQFWKFLFVKYF